MHILSKDWHPMISSTYMCMHLATCGIWCMHNLYVKASHDLKHTACRNASTFQMLRGTMVVFAGLLTIVLLKRRLHLHHWMGIILIVAGAALVGASR